MNHHNYALYIDPIVLVEIIIVKNYNNYNLPVTAIVLRYRSLILLCSDCTYCLLYMFFSRSISLMEIFLSPLFLFLFLSSSFSFSFLSSPGMETKTNSHPNRRSLQRQTRLFLQHLCRCTETQQRHVAHR